MNNSGPIAVNLVGLGMLALLLIGAAGLLHRYGRPVLRESTRRPVLRRPITRAVCGISAILIVIAVGAGTWYTVRQAYAHADQTRAVLPVPTMAAPSAPPETTDPAAVEARFLLDLVLVGVGSPIIHAESFEVRWPRDKGKPVGRALEWASCDIRFECIVDGIDIAGEEIKPVGRLTFLQRRRGVAGGLGAVPIELGARQVGMASWAFQNPPLSIVPGLHPRGAEWCYLIRRVAVEDPLSAAPAVEVLAEHGIKLEAGKPYVGVTAQIPGIMLAAHVGLSFLLLLTAACLAAQCFRTRSLALVGTTLAMVLYIAALDRMVVAMHASRLRDRAAPVEQRMLAKQMILGTFFYRNTAQREANAAQSDEPAAHRRARNPGLSRQPNTWVTAAASAGRLEALDGRAAP